MRDFRLAACRTLRVRRVVQLCEGRGLFRFVWVSVITYFARQRFRIQGRMILNLAIALNKHFLITGDDLQRSR